MAREYPDCPVVGVGVVLWRGDSVLLIRRGHAPRLGQWSLPGGGQELGETVVDTARRELLDETGLRARTLALLTVVDLIDRDEGGLVRHHYTLVDFTGEAAEGEPMAGDDATAVAWFRLDQIEGLGLWSETQRIIRLAAAKRG
jgi:ADP-ribose pyrophosphatase YjhB (NUDIX family)